MSGRQDKKMRKAYRQEARVILEAAAATVDATKETLRKCIAPKPWWCPGWLYKAIVRFVIKGLDL